MKYHFETEQWIKELIKKGIDEPFTSRDLDEIQLGKPAHFFVNAHNNGYLKRVCKEKTSSVWKLTEKAKKLQNENSRAK